MRQVLLVTVVLVVALATQACARTVTVRGELVTGTSDSAIYSLDPDCCVFLTDSEVARSIFNKCGILDECEIQCELNQNKDIVIVHNVRKIDVDIEPSAKAIKKAVCSVTEVGDQDCADFDSRIGVEVVRMNKSNLNNKIIWSVEYVLYSRDEVNSKDVRLGRGVVKIVRSGDEWKWHRN
ncbi:MAG: hypothetical protein AB7U63_15725 [Porticoccaceae bacterium]